MPKAVVLGSGMVGSVIATDLARDHDVTVADVSPTALRGVERRTEGRAATVVADLADTQAVTRLVEGADVAVGALPSRLGRAALETVIDAGVPYCDISFMSEDPLELDERARARGVTAVVDCGVAPGLSNMLAGRGAARVDPCEKIDIFVGGIPRHPTGPFNYKAAFSPADVIEEYTRPARLVEGGQVVVREPLTEIEPVVFPGLGMLEAFNTDGLRTLTQTLAVPGETAFYAGLALIVAGVGLLKPNISTMVGGLYEAGDHKRDLGFNIFYMGINIGALVANLLAAAVRNEWGWLLTFRIAGCGLIISMIILASQWKKLEVR